MSSSYYEWRNSFSIGAYGRVDPCSTSQGRVVVVTAVDDNYNENSVGIVNFSPFIDEGR